MVDQRETRGSYSLVERERERGIKITKEKKIKKIR